MFVDFSIISQAFGDQNVLKNHGVIVKTGSTYKVVQQSSKEKNQKVNAGFVLHSLFAEVKKNERTEGDLKKALIVSKYFVDREGAANSLLTKIKHLFFRINNWARGNGFKTNGELAGEIKTYLEVKGVKMDPLKSIEGFVSEDFWKAMSKNRTQELDPAFKTDSTFKIIYENFVNFCQKVAGKPKVSCTTPPSNSSIPPIIHFIWMGSEVPEKVNEIIKTWRDKHPGWEIKVWGDKNIDTFDWINKPAFDEAHKAKQWAEAADIWRCQILKKFGGIYSDTDVVCFKSYNDLIANGLSFFVCQETNRLNPWLNYDEPLYVCNAVMGASKDSSVIQYCLDNMKPRSQPIIPDNTRKDLLHRTGPVLVSKACTASLKDPKNKDSVLVLPCSYFYPLPWSSDLKGLKMNLDEVKAKYQETESLAVHLWDGSW